jgi:penicillin-binding protein 1A
VPDGIMALRIDPITGIRADNDENGIYENFYHENPPPEVEEQLPSMFDDMESTEDLQLNQVQKLLQPEIVLPARSPAAKPAETTAKTTENTSRNPLNAH